MLDIQLIRDNPEVIIESLEKRGASVDLEHIRSMDQQRRECIVRVDELRAERNAASKAIGEVKKAGGNADEAMARVRELGDDLSAREEELRQLSERLDLELVNLPNLVQPEVPVGGEDDGKVLRLVGEPPVFDFEVSDHLDLGIGLEVIDMERGARTSGSRFAYLMGDLVRLQFALVQFAIDRLGAAGFNPVVPPVLVREEALWGTGFFPTDRGQIYHIPEENQDLYLVGTSEVPLAALHMGEILDVSDLPLRYAGVSPCFRREAGAAGRDTRGIIRVHQFDKVEMFSFTRAQDSREEHEYLLAQEEAIIQALELPYRVVDIAAGDLGAPASRKFDIEVWLPGQSAYRELTSCSNCTDYQARRLKTRIRSGEDGKGPTEHVHTLNGTAIAIARTLVAIMENHQNSDGTISVPEVLRQYGAPSTVEAEAKKSLNYSRP